MSILSEASRGRALGFDRSSTHPSIRSVHPSSTPSRGLSSQLDPSTLTTRFERSVYHRIQASHHSITRYHPSITPSIRSHRSSENHQSTSTHSSDLNLTSINSSSNNAIIHHPSHHPLVSIDPPSPLTPHPPRA